MVKLEEHLVKDIYSGVRGCAVKILNRVERTDAYLDKQLDRELHNTDFSGADKALLYEIVHGVIRWMGRLDWILSGFYKGQFSKAIPILKNALRVALYQIMFLDKVPEYAAVNEAVEFVKKLQGQKPADITNAILRNILKSKDSLRYPDPLQDEIGYLSTFYSHPTWIIKRWLPRFGREATEALLAANNERPVLTLRVNTKKISLHDFENLLCTVNLKFVKGRYYPEFLKLTNLSNIRQWQYFTEGYFNIQDESASLACRLLNVKPGMRALDLCAAPGGKSAYLANLMEDTGEIIALDKFDARLALVEKSVKRLAITSVKTIAIDALEYQNENLFDAVLADVPCSGMGTLCKKPDIKWKKDLLDIRKLADAQFKLLKKASTLIKIGGAVVYSTCTIEPEENYEVVKKFLDENPNFSLENARQYVPFEVVDEKGCVQTYPHIHKMDGAFAARIVRNS
ncbi:MAG: 16S rRNA (cytosine(967)-C(5))-methyltransferase [Ignavibacteria bacterium CG22_combo_CG10-13_8_21_14_all_37_15]|nr:16S rRNA (cytosine(967)-C(5))-methyltransferase RsmB [Ignavibacteria bacterium]PIP76969.1 MAG: 16S rRNA (cytosine(967)-C(5))-methyltransferase [Ignavibacteria bacterium CG22_combo_CG10-13_8_21_14_all_37_15]PJC59823.1 MAG: 16S rRNA (cytosine(967)-C(5))-methyltransferase RsmB [Ignavibacteria bacterium CG_4_9_14_0_2_um_filter_37_13]